MVQYCAQQIQEARAENGVLGFLSKVLGSGLAVLFLNGRTLGWRRARASRSDFSVWNAAFMGRQRSYRVMDAGMWFHVDMEVPSIEALARREAPLSRPHPATTEHRSRKGSIISRHHRRSVHQGTIMLDTLNERARHERGDASCVVPSTPRDTRRAPS